MIKLGDICEFINGGAWSDKEYVSNGIPVLKVSNCKPSGFSIDDINYLPVSAAEKYGKNRLQKGDVIIATVGSHPNLKDSAAGRSCIVNSLVEGYYLNQNAVCIRTFNENVLSQQYLGYLTKHYPFQHYIQVRGRGAANQMRIAISSIKEYAFDLPSIELQRRIADILSAYDNLIENNQRQIKLLEEAAQRLYKEWFIDLRFPGYETTPVVNGVPEGWEQHNLGETASILRRGISPKYDDNGKYLVISQKCIRQSIMNISEARRESKEYTPELNLQDRDTVICSTGTGTLGRVGQVFGAYPDTTFDSHVTLVRTEEYQNFFYQAIKHQQDFLMGMGRGSTNQQELYRGVIENLQILTPTQEVLNKAESLFSTIHDKITALYLQIGLLVEARDRLLPKLMSGELEV